MSRQCYLNGQPKEEKIEQGITCSVCNAPVQHTQPLWHWGTKVEQVRCPECTDAGRYKCFVCRKNMHGKSKQTLLGKVCLECWSNRPMPECPKCGERKIVHHQARPEIGDDDICKECGEYVDYVQMKIALRASYAELLGIEYNPNRDFWEEVVNDEFPRLCSSCICQVLADWYSGEFMQKPSYADKTYSCVHCGKKMDSTEVVRVKGMLERTRKIF